MGNGRSRQSEPPDVIACALRRALGPDVNLQAVPIEQVMEEHTALNCITDIVVLPGVFTVTHSGHLMMVETVLQMLEEMDPPRDVLCVIMPYGSPKHSYFSPSDTDNPDWRLLPDAVFDRRIALLCAAVATLKRQQRVFVCNDMLGDMGDTGRIMDAYELIRTMAEWRWPKAKIHCLCGSDSLDYVQQTLVKASSPKKTASSRSEGQSIYCVDVDGPMSGRRVSEPANGFAPGQSGEIGRTLSTVHTLRVVSAVVHATVEEFEVPGLSKYSTRDICLSLSHPSGLWETQLPSVVVDALKEYLADSAVSKVSSDRKGGKKSNWLGKKK